MKNPKIAASLICANPIDIVSDIKELNQENVEFIHFDVMDGSFVPRYGLYPEILTSLKSKTNIPVDVHMMVSNPEDYIQVFKEAGADYYNFHFEATSHVHRIIKKIEIAGMHPGIALNPATPISNLEYIINDIKMVVLMAINPGIVGHKLIPNMIQKIKDLRKFSIENGNLDLLIEIDGGVTFQSAKLMIDAGADILVCGTGTIFKPQEDSISNKIKALRNLFC
ncbi:MAG: ribulose-phosphate 3-epimerase [Alphaproteobacteria bacterium]|nr:ribulose-phosphate 3-epimerase [Alphaproteobacteria bacterium]